LEAISTEITSLRVLDGFYTILPYGHWLTYTCWALMLVAFAVFVFYFVPQENNKARKTEGMNICIWVMILIMSCITCFLRGYHLGKLDGWDLGIRGRKL